MDPAAPSRPRSLRPATLCLHSGPRRAPGAPLVAPIVRSSTFVCDDRTYAERAAGHGDRSRCYSRETNPTLEVVEERLAALEGAERALTFASGQAALHALLLATLARGDRVVLFRQVYGGTIELCRALLPRLDVEFALVDANDLTALGALADAKLRLVLCESLSNPLTVVADLPAVRRLVNEAAPRALVAVDATLASPVGQRALALGAHVVYHSATKYLGGHSDLIGGAVAGDAELLHECWTWRTKAGGCMDPEAAYLVERGLRTLALRVAAASANALAVARFLAGHPRVERVHYCGLEGDPSHALARALLVHTGGLLSFVVRGGDEAALRVLRRLELFTEAPSLGGVESLATRPRDLSHYRLGAAELAAAGLAPGLLRLAIGVEDPADLIEDLERALG